MRMKFSGCSVQVDSASDLLFIGARLMLSLIPFSRPLCDNALRLTKIRGSVKHAVAVSLDIRC